MCLRWKTSAQLVLIVWLLHLTDWLSKQANKHCRRIRSCRHSFVYLYFFIWEATSCESVTLTPGMTDWLSKRASKHALHCRRIRSCRHSSSTPSVNGLGPPRGHGICHSTAGWHLAAYRGNQEVGGETLTISHNPNYISHTILTISHNTNYLTQP